jgi:hypothetical protein
LQRRRNAKVRMTALGHQLPLLVSRLSVHDGADHNVFFSSVVTSLLAALTGGVEGKAVECMAAYEESEAVVGGVGMGVQGFNLLCYDVSNV